MNCLRLIALCLFISLSSLLAGQQDLSISVRKACNAPSDFTYYGSPVHPKAFFDLNPTDTVDLRVYKNDQSYYGMLNEQPWIQWPNTYQKAHSYGYYYKDSADGYRVNWDMCYVPLGQLPDCRYVILWHCYGGTHLNYTYVTTVSLTGDYLINHWDYITCDLNIPVLLKGYEIVNGNKRYPIKPIKK